MLHWPEYLVVKPGYPPADVQLYCVHDAKWQKIRLMMKGVPTEEKLGLLEDWWELNCDDTGKISYPAEVQVGNYLGALRRGGQLDMNNRVKRYL